MVTLSPTAVRVIAKLLYVNALARISIYFLEQQIVVLTPRAVATVANQIITLARLIVV